jgi:hypothetical protein
VLIEVYVLYYSSLSCVHLHELCVTSWNAQSEFVYTGSLLNVHVVVRASARTSGSLLIYVLA